MRRLVVAAFVSSAALAACSTSDPGAGGDAPPDACAGDCTAPPDAPPEPTWSFAHVYGVPNIDDDDGAGRDWEQPRFASDDDFAKLVLPADALALVDSGGDIELTLTGDVANVRVFRGMEHVLGVDAGAGPFAIVPDGSEITLDVEFGTYGAAAELAIARRTAGSVVETATVQLQAAPLLMNHHLQRAEHLWAVRVNGNAAFIDAYETVLGNKFTAVSGATYRSDIWIQDEIELSTLTAPDQRLDVVIDSIRNRGLDPFPESELVGPGTIAQTWGVASQATTYDSFGNLEASPPVTVDGVTYPFGRIYYGLTGNTGLHSQLRSFLASQRVQAPFSLPTSWLCVGHVDEFSTFVPDPSSPKGFKLVVSDVPAAWEVLQSLPASTSLGRYGNDHGYATVGDMLGDANLVALNNEVQADYLDPIRTKMMTELGLTEADVIRIPSLFEQVGGCNGRVAALIPGMVNLIVANVDGQTTHLFTADPFFRATGAPQSADPVIAAFRQRMPAGLQLHFVDNWNTYHMGLGEVHCGTNVRRTPQGTWWTSAMHLMEGN